MKCFPKISGERESLSGLSKELCYAIVEKDRGKLLGNCGLFRKAHFYAGSYHDVLLMDLLPAADSRPARP